MRSIVAKNIGYPLQDRYKKTFILNTLEFLKKSQYWDEEKIRDYQSEKLQLLTLHAYHNVPYYTKLFDSIRLKPSDIQTIDDLIKIPILTKEIVRKENMNLLSKGYDMRFVKKGKTGGTTGAPVIVYKDITNRSFTWASYYRWYDWMGINYYDPVATFWGARTVITKSSKSELLTAAINYFQNELKINSFEMTDEYMWKIYYKLKKFQPRLIKGYLSALIEFASFLERNKLTDIRPQALSSTTESLMAHHRTFLQRIFNAPIFDQYGCGELSAISYECTAHKGLHINTEHLICEVLDENNLAVLDREGRVVGTDLDNLVMPFIRYENGDLSSISSNKCSCGINQPLMHSITGRSTDTILLGSGKKVHGVFFTNILYELNILSDKVQKFQIYQRKAGEIDFKIQCENSLDTISKKKLINTLNKFFINVNYSEHKTISPENNGKYKYIINDIK